MSDELDTYRETVANMKLGVLIAELLDLRLAPEPDSSKEKITQVQKVREVTLELNRREVVEDDKSSEPRRTKIRSLKNVF
jgi:hypothetical protein